MRRSDLTEQSFFEARRHVLECMASMRNEAPIIVNAGGTQHVCCLRTAIAGIDLLNISAVELNNATLIISDCSTSIAMIIVIPRDILVLLQLLLSLLLCLIHALAVFEFGIRYSVVYSNLFYSATFSTTSGAPGWIGERTLPKKSIITGN